MISVANLNFLVVERDHKKMDLKKIERIKREGHWLALNMLEETKLEVQKFEIRCFNDRNIS